MAAKEHHIVIVGAGTAGLTTGNLLLRKDPSLDIAFIEPSEKHYYQPAWTLVGAGEYDIENTVRDQADYMPAKAAWYKDKVVKLDPDSNCLRTAGGVEIKYQYLIMAPGIQIDWNKIDGLVETLGKNNVCSNYAFEQAPYTYECIKNFKGGTAIFTSPNTPIKCGGAPQKIMYMACDYFKRSGILDKCDVRFINAGTKIFGVKIFADALMRVVNRYGIKLQFHHNLKAIDGPNRTATFDVFEDGKPVSEATFNFDMIHVTPPMSAPDFVKESPLANEAGWVDVDNQTLQHKKYPNVFGLGDAAGTPNAKTGAAVRKQVPILVNNLMQVMRTRTLTDAASYNGYSSCPLVTGKGKMILAEFDYNNEPDTTFPFNQAKERYSMYLLKKYGLPFMYWNRMIKGKP